jgi:hypothetical protein
MTTLTSSNNNFFTKELFFNQELDSKYSQSIKIVLEKFLSLRLKIIED